MHAQPESAEAGECRGNAAAGRQYSNIRIEDTKFDPPGRFPRMALRLLKGDLYS